MLRIAILIPTYNEVHNIQTLLPSIRESVKGADATTIIIDDSSPDGTADAAETLGSTLESDHFRVRVLRKPTKNGLGAAYLYAFSIVAEMEFDYIVQMDADLSHDPSYLPEFLESAREGIDLVVASRYMRGGGAPDWTWNRRFLSRGGNTYARMMLGGDVTDYTGGFNMFSSDLLNRINPQTIDAAGYGFIIALKYRAKSAARSIAQVPIIFRDRTSGVSKLPRNTLITNFLLVALLRFGGKR